LKKTIGQKKEHKDGQIHRLWQKIQFGHSYQRKGAAINVITYRKETRGGTRHDASKKIRSG